MNRKPGMSSIEVSDELRCQVIPLVGKHVSHFSTVEDHFFTEGEALSTGFEDSGRLNDTSATRTPRRGLKRGRFLMGAGVGGLVLVGTVLLVRSGGHAADTSATADESRPAATESVPAAAAPEPTPLAAAPAVLVPAPAITPPSPTPALPPAVPTHEPVAIPAPAPTDERLRPSPGQASIGAVAGPAPTAAFESCKKAFDQHRGKEILSRCTDAFAANPQSADAPVMLAQTEFDRGRITQALDWAKKAIAIDAERADAYVFLGSAEQASGHKAAARAAYKRYLQLSPQGRYAADLRAVLASL
jgi:hypothetical protein